ncbi:5-hydroxyisourate hydrolase [Nitrospira sp.]|nr:5-hydroxyisourate hydrolase [Nitrospira sp.]
MPNLVTGQPAHGVPAPPERRASLRTWRAVAQDRTNEAGRLDGLLPPATRPQSDAYRLPFDVATYFRSQSVPSFHPEVVITFTARETDRHCHIPLLLGLLGYTAYRGS